MGRGAGRPRARGAALTALAGRAPARPLPWEEPPAAGAPRSEKRPVARPGGPLPIGARPAAAARSLTAAGAARREEPWLSGTKSGGV